MPCPLSLAEIAYCNSTQKKIGQFSLHFYSLSSFFPFDLPLPTSQLSIICSGFLVPGRTGFHHVVHAYDRDADEPQKAETNLCEPIKDDTL